MQGTTLVWIGYLLIALGLLFGSIMVSHGNKKNLDQALSEQNVKYKESMKNQEKGYKRQLNDLQLALSKKQDESKNEILKHQENSTNAIINEMNKLNKDKKINDELKSEFPGGYELIAIKDKQIIPSEKPSSEEIKIFWDTAKILNVTKDFIDIRLPDAILPGNSVLENNVVRVINKEGATASGQIIINDWTPFVKILKSDKKRIIAVVGYAKIKNPPLPSRVLPKI